MHFVYQHYVLLKKSKYNRLLLLGTCAFLTMYSIYLAFLTMYIFFSEAATDFISSHGEQLRSQGDENNLSINCEKL